MIFKNIKCTQNLFKSPVRKKQVTFKARTTWLIWAFAHQHGIEKTQNRDEILRPNKAKGKEET